MLVDRLRRNHSSNERDDKRLLPRHLFDGMVTGLACVSGMRLLSPSLLRCPLCITTRVIVKSLPNSNTILLSMKRLPKLPLLAILDWEYARSVFILLPVSSISWRLPFYLHSGPSGAP